MPNQPNPRRPKRGTFEPKPEIKSLVVTSGNTINGLGETEVRQASPFFWHPPDLHPYGELQTVARASSRKCPGTGPVFQQAYTYPELNPVAEEKKEASPQVLSAEVKRFALSAGVDAIGIAQMNPLFVFQGYTIDCPWVIIVVLAHNYDDLQHVPSDETHGIGVTEIGVQYARGTKLSYALANWIREQGYHAKPYPGPSADALLLIPPAIAAGLGELGKHGSLITPQFGSGIRLAGITTDMPLCADQPLRFGADDFCTSCQICTHACPPAAIAPQKQMVRGQERWYVDFDKCITYFAEAASCGICFAECPWTRPEVRPKLLAKMAARNTASQMSTSAAGTTSPEELHAGESLRPAAEHHG